MKNLILLFCLTLFCVDGFGQVGEQYFTDPVETFSKKKTAYLTMSDGTEVQGTIKKLKRTKGLFNEVNLTMENGKVKKIKAEDIQSMYLPQSGWDKFAKGVDLMSNARRWGSDLNEEYLKDGYAYFEQTEVNYRKKKTETLLLQLLNPAFSNLVKIYHDPLAAESASLSYGGIKMVGGNDKSYFVKTGDKVAFRLKKKNLDDNAAEIFADCKDSYEEIVKDKLSWMYFDKLLFEYTVACEE